MVAARGSSRAGLTLIEITISFGILMVLLTGVFAAMASSMRAEVLTREHQAASETALLQLDTVMSNPTLAFVDAESAFDVQFKSGRAGAAPTDTLLSPQDPLPADYAQNRTGRIVTRLINPTLLEVRVSVAWRGADNRPARLDLMSMRSR